MPDPIGSLMKLLTREATIIIAIIGIGRAIAAVAVSCITHSFEKKKFRLSAPVATHTRLSFLHRVTFFSQFIMVWMSLCERLYSKIILGKSHYEGGKKYCRRCEVYYSHNGIFCPCCGMALRMSPTNKRDKERLRQLRLREAFHDSIKEPNLF